MKNLFSNQNKLNPARVGDAALSIIFQPCESKNWKREVSIHSKEEVNLGTIMHGCCRNYLKLWGIEPGLVSIEIKREEQGSIAEILSLSNKFKIKDLEKFSHIIIITEWCSSAPYVHSDSEKIGIYRLTPHAKMIIRAQD